MKYMVSQRQRLYEAVRPLALRWARFWDVDPNCVLAICFVESGFKASATNPGAISLGGAWGLMQITAATGRDLARRVASYAKTRGDYPIVQPFLSSLAPPVLGAPQPPPLPTKTLLDPDNNLMLGAFYLARLIEEFTVFPVAAAAYTWGPGNVRRLHGALVDCPTRVKVYAAKADAARELFANGFTPWNPTGAAVG